MMIYPLSHSDLSGVEGAKLPHAAGVMPAQAGTHVTKARPQGALIQHGATQ
ncbi:MAG: hypothetical protein H6922_05155 [Pseudomonadaceae bacterium]|nr:hypothetical protein [Pseudomonadaceae bacterium]